MKYILLGDIHTGIKNDSMIYHQVVIDLFTDIISYAKENGISNMIQVGDFFDNRKKISPHTIDLISEKISPLISENFENTYIVVGNHDTYYHDNMTPTTLSMFSPYNNIHIVDKPTILHNILMLPWLFDDCDMVDADILIGHFDMNGIPMVKGYDVLSKNHRYSVSDFSKYKKVYSGHYHIKGVYGNVTYIGTPYQMTFNDRDEVKGFYVLDTDTTEIEFIVFDKYPHHIVINDTDINDIDKELITGNNIKVLFTNDYGVEKNTLLSDKIRDMMPVSLKIIPMTISDTFTKEKIDNVSLKNSIDVLRDYIDRSELPDGVNRDMINTIIDEIYGEING